MTYNFKIITVSLLSQYENSVDKNLQQLFEGLKDAELSTDSFSFYTSVASVFSSKIEGEDIELDSYIKHKRFALEFLPDYTRKIDDLYNAYAFAKSHPLNEVNLAAIHKLISKHIVAKHQQGKLRVHNMYVSTPNGRIAYVAATPDVVNDEMQKLYADIAELLAIAMSIWQVFYFAAMIHLVFVKIHPFNDGNGRTARLLEKWFIAQKLGDQAWFIQSEKNYYLHHEAYYNNLSVVGLEYIELDYSKAKSFLLMLPQALTL
jgi:Fic family protein